MLRASQAGFAETGGMHAVGLFTADGELIASREDVGRHNAMDKLVGAALRDGELPWSQRIVLLSGRASFELIQKAMMAGAPLVAAIGAPSTLAVELAESAGITLVAFLRPGGCNVYTHGARVRARAGGVMTSRCRRDRRSAWAPSWQRTRTSRVRCSRSCTRCRTNSDVCRRKPCR